MRNAYRILVGKPERKRGEKRIMPEGDPRAAGYERVDWIHLSKSRPCTYYLPPLDPIM